jgi:hypothetical protein
MTLLVSFVVQRSGSLRVNMSALADVEQKVLEDGDVRATLMNVVVRSESEPSAPVSLLWHRDPQVESF